MAGDALRHGAAQARDTRGTRSGAALLSVASNSVLILLKVVAGTITGSVALLTEALHSAIDLIASVVAFFSLRKADEPADENHPFGHDKVEDLAAAIEGVLILVGSGVIVFEAIRRLAIGGHVEQAGIGLGVLALSITVNMVVSARLMGRARAAGGSPALEADAAHLRTDAATSAGVFVGLALVAITDAQWLDPVVALVVALAIVVSGVRIVTRSSRALVDEALPEVEMEAIRSTVKGFGDRGVAGFHALRARRAGPRRLVDLHVQFRAGTTLEDAHAIAHELQDAIRAEVGGADVLIHLEPEDRVRPGTEVRPAPSAG
ncbi:cation diffusion facilitator family transporter [Conexibacter sp. SYSU D00693]|uniref:cation diffusion facilitator family transporter n=1 Tax=Conexibacter sp. SYSU D00693 TaxID=2812560 RepID=UPI00196A4ABA|nr:cation diffusion facilitator family transporter [Conexibacter sp. SYSU D00693]